MSLNDSIKQLQMLSKSLGSLQSLVDRVKVEAVENSGFSDEEKKKMRNVLKSINFEELAKNNTTPEQLKEIINTKLK